MHWEDVPHAVDRWVEKAAGPGFAVRQAAASVITASHVGYYLDPESGRVGVFAPLAAAPDAARVKAAASRAAGAAPFFLSYQALADPAGSWVKVAHSPALRRAGELTNFFPGQYPGGVPNSPSPLAAMLTSGLLGAGLGWGAGKLVGAVLPPGYGKKLSRTGLLLGGAAGAAPGLLWGATNKLDGRPFNDPALLGGYPGDEPLDYPTAMHGANAPADPAAAPGDAAAAVDRVARRLRESPVRRLKFGEDLAAVELGATYRAAVEKVADTFGVPEAALGRLPTDVNIDALGRTLWDAGASPALAASTMAGMYAAQQIPDPAARPGWATGNQLGRLAANAAGDYVRGRLAGAAINVVIGTPFRSSSFGTANAVLGVIGAVVPRLFGG